MNEIEKQTIEDMMLKLQQHENIISQLVTMIAVTNNRLMEMKQQDTHSN